MRTIPLPPVAAALLLAWVSPSSAQTTIDAADKHAYGANVGWVNLAGNVTAGVIVSEYLCSGYAWSANTGWIHFGDGTADQGIFYSNNSASDFGVNVSNYQCPAPGVHTADLRGFAYGANIGWINFENTGDPRINLSSGKLLGYAWGTNVGWINLGEMSANVEVVTSLAPGADSDKDDIVDAWEYTHAGFPDLSSLGDTPGADFDGDGQSDLEEYESDTDPLDPTDRLRMTLIATTLTPGDFDVTFTTKPTRIYYVHANADLASPWVEALGPLKPTGTTTTATVKEPGGDGFHFWRATARRPLQP